MTFEERMELTESEKIKFYIGAYKTADVDDGVKRTGTKKTRKKSVEFEVTLSSALDTVIDRTEGGITRRLIFMPSQDKYVVMEGSTVQKLEDIPYNMFLAFFNGFPKEGITISNIVFDKISKDDAYDIYNMVLNERGPLHNGMMSLSLFRGPNYIKSFLKDNPKIWKLATTKTPILSGSGKYGGNFLCTALIFFNVKGYDVARYFVESYTKSSMIDIDGVGLRQNYYMGSGPDYYTDNQLLELLHLASFDSKRLIDYLCFDLYSQGINKIPLSTYCDFISMSVSYYGNASRIPDKYPKALSTEHDIISLKYDQAKEEIDERIFKSQYDSFRKEMKMEDDTILFKHDYIVIQLPEEAKDLVEEGQSLGHCVGTYIDRVMKGECLILFARHKGKEAESYLTVELRKRLNSMGDRIYEIAQVQGDNKRTSLTKDEIEALKSFMKEKNFETSNSNLA